MGAPQRAAQYLRMSTEHQQYSPEYQAAIIAAYAAEHGYEVIQTYADLGISGLHLKRREGLQRLLQDVVGGVADYSVILVYDVSRWGRFQDPDQAAHYEFLCREAGISVEYCAEMFENDGSFGATIMKSVKRVMAAEFSRELGAKVLAAQLVMAARGYKQGGPAPYGLRRMMVNADGQPKQVLAMGEYKALRTDRTIFVPGPPDEVEVVRRAFRLFVYAGMTRTAIADLLKSEGVPSRTGTPWSQRTLTLLLTNEAYAGVLVFNRQTQRLGARKAWNPKGSWLRIHGAIQPLVRTEMFEIAQRAIGSRFRRFSDIEMLDLLRGLLAREGRLSWNLVKDAEGVPCPQTYRDRFGSLKRAFQLVGYAPKYPFSGAVARRVEARQARLEAAAMNGINSQAQRDPTADQGEADGRPIGQSPGASGAHCSAHLADDPSR